VKYSEIIRRVRQTAGDVLVLQFTDDMLVDWINDGVREVALENNLLQKTATSSTVIGVSQVTLPTDIMKLYSVQVDNEKIRILSYQEFEELSAGAPSGQPQTGSPSQCYVWAGVLNLAPPPDSVKPLKINYIYDPVDVATSNLAASPPIPSSYHLRLVTYCLAQVAMQDDDIEKANMYLAQFRSGVIDLRSQSETEEDLYPFISVSSRDMGEWPGSLEWGTY